MKRTILAACLAATLATPALAGGGFPPSVESCDTLAEAVVGAKKLASDHHGKVAFLDGDAAHRFLASVVPTSGKLIVTGDHVAVFTDTLTSSVFVAVADGICGGYATQFGLETAPALAALAAAQH